MVNIYEITVHSKLYYRTNSLPPEDPNDCVSCTNQIESWHCNKVSTFKRCLLETRYLIGHAYKPKNGFYLPGDYVVELSRVSHQGPYLRDDVTIEDGEEVFAVVHERSFEAEKDEKQVVKREDVENFKEEIREFIRGETRSDSKNN